MYTDAFQSLVFKKGSVPLKSITDNLSNLFIYGSDRYAESYLKRSQFHMQTVMPSGIVCFI